MKRLLPIALELIGISAIGVAPCLMLSLQGTIEVMETRSEIKE